MIVRSTRQADSDCYPCHGSMEPMYNFLPGSGPRVVGGVGALGAVADLAGLAGDGAVLIVTSPSMLAEQTVLDRVRAALAPRSMQVYDAVKPGSPIEVVEA